eukprot:2974248-Prymnesium_polylepis.1
MLRHSSYHGGSLELVCLLWEAVSGNGSCFRWLAARRSAAAAGTEPATGRGPPPTATRLDCTALADGRKTRR